MQTLRSMIAPAAGVASGMRRMTLILLTLLLTPAAGGGRATADSPIATVNHFISHRSTVPASRGELAGLYVRERYARPYALGRPAVLMIHGAPISSTPAFDVRFKSYSWMAALATVGFDVFAMDLTGYGLSPKPMMGDPCNASAADQAILALSPCVPRYPFRLTTAESEWDEIDTVVDYIRRSRNVRKVDLIGWSVGGARAGAYAARHPEKIDKLLLYAPTYARSEPDAPPAELPQPGVALSIRPATFVNWDLQVGCTDQFEPEIRNAIVSEIEQLDPLVENTWRTSGYYRAPVLNARRGWNAAFAAQIAAPTLIIRGALDTQVPEATSRELFDDLTVDRKVFVRVSCASHFMLWERQHRALARASVEWLRHGRFAGSRSGFFTLDTNGQVQSE